MRTGLVALAALAALPAFGQDWMGTRPAPAPGYEYPAAYCVNRGARVELGETTCIVRNCCPDKDCEVFTARCAMSVNVPTFRKLRDGCEAISLPASPPASVPPGPG